MCEPRRIEVTLSSEIDESWRGEVEEQATVHRVVTESIERVVPLRGRLGGTAQVELDDLFAEGFRGWQRDEEQQNVFVLLLDVVELRYDGGTGDLTIRASANDLVEATAQATSVAETRVRAVLSATGEGMYYDDGFNNRTPELAEQAAQQQADREIVEAEAAAREEQTREARAAARERASQEASDRAEREAAEQAERLRVRLHEALRQLLDDSSDLVQAELSAIVGEVMRRGVLRIVKANGGRLLEVHEDDASIVIEAEI